MPSGLSQKLRKSLRRRGIGGTMVACGKVASNAILRLSPSHRRKLAQKNRSELEFDRRYGVDTRGLIGLDDLSLKGNTNRDFCNGYEPVRPWQFHEMMRALDLDFHGFTFIDFGSGKGRALLLASHYPFKRIVGVEFAAELSHIAEQNIRRYRDPEQKCNAIEAVCMDAAAYALPDGPAVLYFYNPFEKPIMARVLSNIGQTISSSPRPVYVVYCNPVEADLLDAAPFLEKVKHEDDFYIYRVQIIQSAKFLSSALSM